ncbi:MAG TPA: hypothetical protein VFR23_19470 [Jiangellaceae bacterium]|nr:hypothetical protein [Jiangellaceae bacterium]
MTTRMMTLTLDLPSGEHATAIVARDSIGVAVNGRACLAHRPWMTPDQLRLVAHQATELADALAERKAGRP